MSGLAKTLAELQLPVAVDTTLGEASPLPQLTCRLTFPLANAVRVQVGAAPAAEAGAQASGYELVTDTPGTTVLRSDELTVEIEKAPAAVRLRAVDGTPIVSVAIQKRPPLGEFELRVSGTQEARIYGCGERFNAVDQRGKVLHNWSIDMITSKFADTYAPVPWFMSTGGFGLALGNKTASIFDFRLEGRNHYEIRTSAFYVSGLYEWLGQRQPELDFTLFYGPDLRRLYESYISVAGRPYLMPEWAFEPLMGPAWPRDFTPAVIDEYVAKLEELRLPHRTFYFDGFWEQSAGDLAFKHFPDPKRLVDSLHERGYRVVLWTAPWLNLSSPAAQEARERGFLLTQAADRSQPFSGRPVIGGYFVDFTNPDAVVWYRERMRAVLEWGIDGFFADFGEADDIRNAAFANGELGVGFGEYYTILYHRTLHEICREVRGDDFYLISRAGWTGIQEWAGLCSGDQGTSYDYMPVIMNGLQSAALSGQAFVSHCLGGYAGDHAKGPYLRWIQMGVFGPLFSIWNHGGVRTEPWSFDDPEVVEIYRRYARLRMALIPHVYSYAKRASEGGPPLVQALGFAFEDDPEAARWEDEYLFCDEFLVAPVYSDANEREVYLPAGSQWYDFWTREAFDGGVQLKYQAPLETLPVFVRAGSLVVTREPDAPGELCVSVWRGARGELIVFQRDASARFSADDYGSHVLIHTMPVPFDALWLRVLPTERPSGVSGAGDVLQEQPNRGALGERATGWCYDGEDRCAWIKLPGRSEARVRVECSHSPE